MKKLGIPYMGSKRGIANDIVSFIKMRHPNAKYFYDLFGGGGAVSFAALDYFDNVIYNELNTGVVELLKKILTDGVTEEFYQWVDRETFHKHKDYDTWFGGLIKTCWSFGNKQNAYMYGNEIEEYKHHGHKFILYDNDESKEHIKDVLKDSYYWHLDNLPKFEKWQDKRLYFVDIILKLEAIRVTRLYSDLVYNEYKDLSIDEFKALRQKEICRTIDKYIPDIPKKNGRGIESNKLSELKYLQHLEHIQRLQHLERIDKFESLQRLKNLEHLQRIEKLEQFKQIQHIEHLGRIEHLEHFQHLQQLQHLGQIEHLENLRQTKQFTLLNHSYNEVKITTPIDETIIYLDPPYKDTGKYQHDINHDELMAYIKNSKYPIYTSGYKMNLPSVWNVEKRVLLNKVKAKVSNENLYINEAGIKSAGKRETKRAKMQLQFNFGSAV
jgi:16S rRNA G966 N2-methylase RsmD